ncbi:uncharacterized protein Tco025E_06190 [Trypanosoma conorhini]|uniref:Uncharacterized protein n=1 Tax=Trypanosoma conorhini TaxID=83891 RepID=A0A3R7P795_9TRYP|nr:uncharacterized protein Tco025E_06190 [Trypanosoma conorhini]RNF13857.1 hypothetical protein Tco025E_06190 [Trypanosoma conorhini]
MVFLFLRCLFASILFNAGVAYAVILALQVPFCTVAGKECAKKPITAANIPIYALKLWIMITFLASFSYLGADGLPLFLEARAILTWLLLLLPPSSQSKVYDTVFEPVLENAGNFFIGFENKRMLARGAAVLALRSCIAIGIFIARTTIRYWGSEHDVIHHVLESLLHASRCLQDTAVRQPETLAYFSPSSPVLLGPTLA